MVTPRAAQPGDLLVLTKPVGTGTISTALKSGIALPEATGEAARWMMTLNRDASRAMVAAGARAATDVTGFGLLGHLADLCAASGVSAVISFSSVPLLPFALKYIRAGSVPGGTLTNLEAAREYADLSAVDEDARLVLADPQTSGGLLISLHPSSLPAFRRASTGDVLASVVGRVEDGPAGRVSVHP
jgi:selenide,water dikinase